MRKRNGTTQAKQTCYFLTHESDKDRENRAEAQERVEGVWDFFPKANQGHFIIDGAIKFEHIVLLDPKGDVFYDFPHIYVDFEGAQGPFAGFVKTFRLVKETIELDDTWKRINVFPKNFSKPKPGKVHMKSPITLDPETLKSFKDHYDGDVALYSIDDKYDFLRVKDVAPISEAAGDGMGESFIQITNKYQIKLRDYVAKKGYNHFIQQSIEHQLGLDKIGGDEDLIVNVYEFKRTYRWKFEKQTSQGRK